MSENEYRWIVQVMQSDDCDWEPFDGPAYATREEAQAVADRILLQGEYAQAVAVDKHA